MPVTKLPNTLGLTHFFKEQALRELDLEHLTTETGIVRIGDTLILGSDQYVENSSLVTQEHDFDTLEEFLSATDFELEFHYRTLHQIDVGRDEFPDNSVWGDIWIGLYQFDGTSSVHGDVVAPWESDYKHFLRDETAVPFEVYNGLVDQEQFMRTLRQVKQSLIRKRIGEYDLERYRILREREQAQYQRVSKILGISPEEAKQFCCLPADGAVGYILAKRFPDGIEVDYLHELMGRVMSPQKSERGLERLQAQETPERAYLLQMVGRETPPLIVKGSRYVLRDMTYERPSRIF